METLITIAKGQEIALTVLAKNELITGAVIVTKVDAADKQHVLAGARFELLDATYALAITNSSRHNRLQSRKSGPADRDEREDAGPQRETEDEAKRLLVAGYRHRLAQLPAGRWPIAPDRTLVPEKNKSYK